MNITDQTIQQVIADQSRQLDHAILLAIQKHLPDVTRQNVADYARRIQIIRRDGQPGERLYLDFGTPRETLLCEIGPITTEFTGTSGKVSQAFRFNP